MILAKEPIVEKLLISFSIFIGLNIASAATVKGSSNCENVLSLVDPLIEGLPWQDRVWQSSEDFFSEEELKNILQRLEKNKPKGFNLKSWMKFRSYDQVSDDENPLHKVNFFWGGNPIKDEFGELVFDYTFMGRRTEFNISEKKARNAIQLQTDIGNLFLNFLRRNSPMFRNMMRSHSNVVLRVFHIRYLLMPGKQNGSLRWHDDRTDLQGLLIINHPENVEGAEFQYRSQYRRKGQEAFDFASSEVNKLILFDGRNSEHRITAPYVKKQRPFSFNSYTYRDIIGFGLRFDK